MAVNMAVEILRAFNSAPARVVMETLGHSNISITMDTYTHVLSELQRQAADAMDRALGQQGMER